MLLCDISEITPGSRLGAAVVSESSPEVELLKPGVMLDERMLQRLRKLGVRQVWIDHDLTRDLDAAVQARLAQNRLAAYNKLKDDLSNLARRTISSAHLNVYRQIMADLVCEIVGNSRYAGLTDRLFASKGNLFSHSTNVAYLAIITGLELETYIIRERPRLSSEHARDLVGLGLSAMLHDVGKIAASEDINEHEVHLLESLDAHDPLPDGYRRHALMGYRMLQQCRATASVAQCVLNHHQRYDGTGWPDLSEAFGPRHSGPQEGSQIHIFTRIVGAANVLENLLRTADGSQRPPIAALYEFAGPRFDGWFDPVVRRALLKRIPPFAVGSHVRLNDGVSAVVTRPSLKSPCRPTVRLLDAPVSVEDGEPPSIDLAERPELSIVACTGESVEQWHYEIPTAAAA